MDPEGEVVLSKDRADVWPVCAWEVDTGPSAHRQQVARGAARSARAGRGLCAPAQRRARPEGVWRGRARVPGLLEAAGGE